MLGEAISVHSSEALALEAYADVGHDGKSIGSSSKSEAPERDLRIFRARELLPESSAHRRAESFSTGIEAVDRLLDGGLVRGEVVEIVGWRSSGRYSVVLSTLAAATRSGETAALIDLGDHFDPQIADRATVDLERLLWLRPEHGKQALGAAEMLLQTGFPLVVLDLGNPPVPGGRGVEAFWVRLARAALAHDGVLLVAAPYRVSGATAHAVIEIRRGRPIWQRSGAARAQPLLAGLELRALLLKGKGRLAGADRRRRGMTRYRLRLFSPTVAHSGETALSDQTALSDRVETSVSSSVVDDPHLADRAAHV